MKIFIAIAVLILLACSPESPALIDPIVNSYGGFTDDDPPADMPNVHLPKTWEMKNKKEKRSKPKLKLTQDQIMEKLLKQCKDKIKWSRKNNSLYIKYLASLDSLSFQKPVRPGNR